MNRWHDISILKMPQLSLAETTDFDHFWYFFFAIFDPQIKFPHFSSEFSEPEKKIRSIFKFLLIFNYSCSFLEAFWPLLTQKFESGIFMRTRKEIEIQRYITWPYLTDFKFLLIFTHFWTFLAVFGH